MLIWLFQHKHRLYCKIEEQKFSISACYSRSSLISSPNTPSSCQMHQQTQHAKSSYSTVNTAGSIQSSIVISDVCLPRKLCRAVASWNSTAISAGPSLTGGFWSWAVKLRSRMDEASSKSFLSSDAGVAGSSPVDPLGESPAWKGRPGGFQFRYLSSFRLLC